MFCPGLSLSLPTPPALGEYLTTSPTDIALHPTDFVGCNCCGSVVLLYRVRIRTSFFNFYTYVFFLFNSIPIFHYQSKYFPSLYFCYFIYLYIFKFICFNIQVFFIFYFIYFFTLFICFLSLSLDYSKKRS